MKASIDHHQALLRLHADPVVADAFDLYVNIAKTEAGSQMHEAWKAAPVTRDEDVNLHNPLTRDASNATRGVAVEAMQAHLRRRWFHAETRERFKKAKRNVTAAVQQHAPDKEAAAARKAKEGVHAATRPVGDARNKPLLVA